MLTAKKVCAFSAAAPFRRGSRVTAFAYFLERSTVSGPALCCHVCHVVGMRAEEQVVGAHAPRVIARVADFTAFRDFPECPSVRNAMGEPSSAIQVEPWVLSLPAPLPATIAFDNLIPEPFIRCALKPSRRSAVDATSLSHTLVVSLTQRARGYVSGAIRCGTGLLIHTGIIPRWNDAGTLRLRGYTRATGWQTL